MVQSPTLVAVAREKLTVSSSVKTLTSSVYKSSSYIVHFARIQVQDAAIRVNFEGTDPVAGTTGDLLNPGDVIEVWGTEDISTFEAIRDTSTDATISVTYFGRKI